ncbi:unnamed protein product [Cylicocyclus nassatus]|uniref:MADF domain-containing protein n=1 Tax=Cylicocyclus nassatus TaxID=53992 RepID=A0AA36DQQ4_CYLNA|nr:unnamed protein product [Cylicocyclus nassatus]
MDSKIDRETLAALVESEPCLWYLGHDHFHRRDKKDEAWEKIVEKARRKGIICDGEVRSSNIEEMGENSDYHQDENEPPPPNWEGTRVIFLKAVALEKPMSRKHLL